MTRHFTVGSLFSGIGGLDLGLERAGMTVAWQSEIDPYCCRILAKHWPGVPNLGDVTTINWSSVPRVDLICGGYPCQPFSLAGRRLGDRDPRHLWPFMLDAIRVLRPRWALLENVPGHLALGFGRVLGDLAEIGFDAEWDCIPAAAVGAPHLRWRVFVVAYPHSESQPSVPVDAVTRPRLVVPDSGSERHEPQPRGVHGDAERNRPRVSELIGGGGADVADTDSLGRGHGHHGTTAVLPRPIGNHAGWRTPLRDTDHWDVEPDVGRVAHGIPHRVDRLRALGNAVVPQVAEHIGRLIVEAAA